jgi:GTP-binding protein
MGVNEARHKRIATSRLNKIMREAIAKHPPPQKGGVRVKFFYVTQPETVPPLFVFFVNKPQWVHFSYRRYLENRLREAEPFPGTPIRLRFRARSEDRFGR